MKSRVIQQNIFVYSKLVDLANLQRNRRIRGRLEAAQAIDPLRDFNAFGSAVRNLKAESSRTHDALMWSGVGTESLFYGHLKALSEYAGRRYREEDRLLLPAIEHGITWLPDAPVFEGKPYAHCVISQGAYRKAQSVRVGRPHYVLGPYTAYVDGLLTAQQLEAAKARLGSTALLFPAHTYEGSSVSCRKEEFVEKAMADLSSAYDSVLVSAYWHDADDDLFRMFADAGAVVLSAGLRSDTSFLARLKTMIQLSDVVIGNSLGTHIGYALAEGRPYIMANWGVPPVVEDFGGGRAEHEIHALAQAEDRVEAAFCANSPLVGGALTDDQKDIYEFYWGGEEKTKSPEDVAAVFDISSDILEGSRGFCNRYESTIGDCLAQYEKGAGSENARKARILREALASE